MMLLVFSNYPKMWFYLQLKIVFTLSSFGLVKSFHLVSVQFSRYIFLLVFSPHNFVAHRLPRSAYLFMYASVSRLFAPRSVTKILRNILSSHFRCSLKTRQCNCQMIRPGYSLTATPQKGGDPAAPSDTATLLRLHPSHRPHLRRLLPCGQPTGFGCE